MKPTLVVGASPRPGRYANIAVRRLKQYNHKVYAYGKSAGEVEGVPIITQREEVDIPELDTLTLYLNPYHQEAYYDWFLKLAPRRVIFNPGTENPELVRLLKENDIEPQFACTLVLLSTGQY